VENFKKMVTAWRADLGDPNLGVIMLLLRPGTKTPETEFPTAIWCVSNSYLYRYRISPGLQRDVPWTGHHTICQRDPPDR
jgi:hypothetical protein